MALKNRNLLSLIGALSLSVVSLSAQAAADADSLQQVVGKGKALFMTATFSGNGRHCNTCHKGGGTIAGKLPNGKRIPSLSNAAAIFPRYDAKHHRVKTLLDQVQFCARNLAHQRPLQRIGAEKRHVKMWVTDGLATREAVWWNGGEKSLPVGKFDLAFQPQINRFNGNSVVQLKVLNWRPAVSQ